MNMKIKGVTSTNFRSSKKINSSHSLDSKKCEINDCEFLKKILKKYRTKECESKLWENVELKNANCR